MSINSVTKKVTIVITRPATRADKLISQLTDLGYHVLNIPCVEIHCVDPVLNLVSQPQSITDYSIIIFVSVNAVISFFEIFKDIQFTNKTKFLTIGRATAQELQKYSESHNILNISYPGSDKQETSEYFVKLPELAEISADNILLIRGDTSREYIATYLAKRASSLTELITYKTVITDGVITSKQLVNNNLIILITSISCLENFYKKLDADDVLLKNNILLAKILVVSQRIANRAKDLGFTKIYCTFSMHDRAIIDMINEIN